MSGLIWAVCSAVIAGYAIAIGQTPDIGFIVGMAFGIALALGLVMGTRLRHK
jgi:hypothetical protein